MKQKTQEEEIIQDHGIWTTRELNPILKFLYVERYKRAIKLIEKNSNKDPKIVDLGCGGGDFLPYLDSKRVIGIDIYKQNLMAAKKFSKDEKCEFICGNIEKLPLKKESVDIITCISVIEHMEKLDNLIKNVFESLIKNGIFVCGYPIETDLYRMAIKILRPSVYDLIDPKRIGDKNFMNNAYTHKQNYLDIRKSLSQYFTIIDKEKIFFNIPDSLCYYECVMCRKKDE